LPRFTPSRKKAGEGIELIHLRREKTRLGTQITRRLAERSNSVYEKIAADRLDDVAEQLAIKDTLLEIAQGKARMGEIDKRRNRAMKGQG